MATRNLRHIYGQLDTGANDPVGVVLLEALIDEIERLQQRVDALEAMARDANALQNGIIPG